MFILRTVFSIILFVNTNLDDTLMIILSKQNLCNLSLTQIFIQEKFIISICIWKEMSPLFLAWEKKADPWQILFWLVIFVLKAQHPSSFNHRKNWSNGPEHGPWRLIYMIFDSLKLMHSSFHRYFCLFLICPELKIMQDWMYPPFCRARWVSRRGIAHSSLCRQSVRLYSADSEKCHRVSLPCKDYQCCPDVSSIKYYGQYRQFEYGPKYRSGYTVRYNKWKFCKNWESI